MEKGKTLKKNLTEKDVLLAIDKVVKETITPMIEKEAMDARKEIIDEISGIISRFQAEGFTNRQVVLGVLAFIQAFRDAVR